ncbi:lipoate--protein ligase family protein [Dolichospermum sp. FACHB-1091]|uniref:lipoate--protein ligase family protein n=1 Tax=Dolichospermum sp. FACHB-1091 TaxID=2692798 RepID=UPI0016808EF7|nr:biotin/lipoate A/B protein ligase family protein [Dolichospermum sp. FACHB-1091]MBD2444833.1 lipoate--protein ligase family protein [Dolichospermum sp. FACHB-1091]
MPEQRVWRLIPILAASGSIQMAIDRWLLVQHELGKCLPTLRFYTWSPPAISLGYHQRQYPEFWQNLIWKGQKLDLVRRPTGGRAVLHQGDLTYSVVSSGVRGNTLEIYAKICEFLIQGWRSLGIELYYGQAGRGYIHNPNCFGTATGADLVLADGSKLIGSAQLRRGDAVLQHGSIRLNPDGDLFVKVFNQEFFDFIQFPESINQETIIKALIAAACDCFAMEIEVIPLSENEWNLILADC